MGDLVKKTIFIDDLNEASILYGSHDKYLRLLKEEFCVGLVARNGMVKINGDKERVKMVTAVFETLINIVKSSGELRDEDVADTIKEKKMGGFVFNEYRDISDEGYNFNDGEQDGEGSFWDVDDKTEEDTDDVGDGKYGDNHLDKDGVSDQPQIDVFFRDAIIQAKTIGQKEYVETIKNNIVSFCIGPAGSGKTYLAVALALSALKNNIVKKIVLARPAVEAGEKLGFLPGDIQAKVNPYLRPLYDALSNMMDTAQVKKYLENDLIEILPLAFMRGRTLNNSFIILDEAQNCTAKQMKTFLTRLGYKSRIVVTGDITQVDLPKGEISGLIDVQEKLANIKGIGFTYLAKSDIVRHKLVQDIVNAYEKFEK